MQALERRPFKFKNPTVRFFCPLCRSKRALSQGPRLLGRHFLRLIFLSLLTTALFYPLMGPRGIFSFFIYWPLFELVYRAQYRKEIPCPYCGFDAAWYKRDVRVARNLVHKFWNKTPG